MGLTETIRAKARADRRRIVLPEELQEDIQARTGPPEEKPE